MSAFISPRVAHPFEHDGVTFQCRPLTAEQKLPILMAASLGEDRLSFGPDAFRVALENGLVGWSGNGAPPWNASDQRANVDQLSDAAYLAVGQEILNTSFLDATEKKTSPLP